MIISIMTYIIEKNNATSLAAKIKGIARQGIIPQPKPNDTYFAAKLSGDTPKQRKTIRETDSFT